MTILIPAILSTKQAHDYVGGSRIWEELLAKHPDIIKPVRTLPRGDSWYRRETIDSAIRQAEALGSLIQDGHNRPLILERKTGNRFKPSKGGDLTS